jgi:hypothetical protein
MANAPLSALHAHNQEGTFKLIGEVLLHQLRM